MISTKVRLSVFILLSMPSSSCCENRINKLQSCALLGTAAVLVTGAVCYGAWAYSYIHFYRQAISSAPPISIGLKKPIRLQKKVDNLVSVSGQSLSLEQRLALKRKGPSFLSSLIFKR